tara:strand:- start:2263 stop:2487 length:225 start_codon:yes stop_codon:yes gene_type:complete
MTKFPLENLKHHKVEEGIYKLVGGNTPFNNKYEWIHHSYKGSFDPHEYDKALALLNELNNRPGRAFTHYRIVSG